VRTIIIVFFFLFNFGSYAQKFWITTYEFPGGPKTCITRFGDSTFFVATFSGVIRSVNQCYRFDTVLANGNISALHVTASGRLLAGEWGKIYRSDNNGGVWDSTELNINFPILKIIEKPNGNLFAITGIIDTNGYSGAGVFFSNNNGETWTPRNNGLGNYLCADEICFDKSGRLFLAVADEFSSGNGGLFYSDNDGLFWNHVNITIDGMGVVNDNINVTKTTALSVSPNDSLYFSFEGVAVNVGVRLNLHTGVNDINTNSKWLRETITNTSTWWSDRILSSIHFAKNGDRYSSLEGSINTGGTAFLKSGTKQWHKHDEGLGLNVTGGRSFQRFTETSTGKVFMIQLFDERIYVTDTSEWMLSNIGQVNNGNQNLLLFPNPVHAGCVLNITLNEAIDNRTVTLFDITGKEVLNFITNEKHCSVISPLQEGVFILSVVSTCEKLTTKLVVR
jgi:hypothetical protein